MPFSQRYVFRSLPANRYHSGTPTMRHCRLLVAAFFTCFVVFSHVGVAQVRAPGDVDPLGRVLAKVIAGMAEPGALSHPISGLQVVVVGERGDSTTIVTDDAGIAT